MIVLRNRASASAGRVVLPLCFALHVCAAPGGAAATSLTLPLSFEPNVGQAAADVQFVARGAAHDAWLTERGAVLRLHRGSYARSPHASGAVIGIRPLGSTPCAAPEALHPLPGTVNYFVGEDRARWRSGVPTYGAVRCADVYRGVDLVWYGNERQLEYDFVLAPGASVARVQLQFDGIVRLSKARDGSLVLVTPAGDVVQRKPIAYQLVDGERRSVEVRYRVLGKERVGFEAARYDARRPLVIDPVLVVSTYMGGGSPDRAFAMSVDASGHAYVTGYSYGGFPTTPGAYQSNAASGASFVAKLNAAGTALVYSTYFGAGIAGVAVDAAGNAYVTGSTSGGLPTTPGAYQTSYGGGLSGAFVAKLNASGTALVYSTYLGGALDDHGAGIAVDANGNAHVTGSAKGGFPTTPGAYQTTLGGASGNDDIFVTKLNAAGTALVYSTYVGGYFTEVGSAIAVDAAGNAYVTGLADYTLPTTPGSAQPGSGGGHADAFVVKLNSSGTALVYSTFIGGSGYEFGRAIAVDAAGAAYVTGETWDNFRPGSGFPTTVGAYQPAFGGGSSDAFVTKVNANGNAFAYSTHLGGTGADESHGIAVDRGGRAYVVGTTSGGFPTTPGAPQPNFGGVADGFMTKLDASGSALVVSTYLGGTNVDEARAVGLDRAGNAYVAGFAEAGFPTLPGAYQANYGGQTDAFLAKFSTGFQAGNDFSGDVRSDLLWRNAANGETQAWLMNGVAATSTATLLTDPAWSPEHTGDFDGDGRADLVWRNASTGETAIWLMNGTSFVDGAVILASPQWRVTRVGDFNGDGRSDLVWHNGASGETAIWLMNGKAFIGGSVVLVHADWAVTHVADFDGDGRSDLVWRNATTGQTALWLMNGASLAGGSIVLASLDWSVTHTGDFNGDGKHDLVWRNATTGQTAIWLMNGATMAGGAVILADPQWAVTHVADFDGDGRADLVWRNAGTASTALWVMDGSAMKGGAVVLSGSNWAVTRTDDYNGDGQADLVWRHGVTGETAMWLMNGTTMTGGAAPLFVSAFSVQ
jgi:hypothetical protein